MHSCPFLINSDRSLGSLRNIFLSQMFCAIRQVSAAALAEVQTVSSTRFFCQEYLSSGENLAG